MFNTGRFFPLPNIFFLHSVKFLDAEATDADNWLYLFNIHDDYVMPQNISSMYQIIEKKKIERKEQT